MTSEQFAEKINRQIKEITTFNRPFALGVQAAHVEMTERIFDYGQDTSNNQIGNYSTKGIYINPKKTATRNGKGFNPLKGKTGKSQFKDGRSHVTSYFEGWKGFRDVQGVRTDYVNLNYTGELFSDFARKPKKISVNEYDVSLDKDGSIEKARGNEAHFGKQIFYPSRREIDTLLTTTEKELKLLLS